MKKKIEGQKKKGKKTEKMPLCPGPFKNLLWPKQANRGVIVQKIIIKCIYNFMLKSGTVKKNLSEPNQNPFVASLNHLNCTSFIQHSKLFTGIHIKLKLFKW